jgi:hypothetical protein
MLKVDAYDQGLIDIAVAAMRTAIKAAHSPVGVAKRLVTVAVKHRNRGRLAAIKRHPFLGHCEASGLVIEKHDAVLDEMDPEKGLRRAGAPVTRLTTAGRGPAEAAEDDEASDGGAVVVARICGRIII